MLRLLLDAFANSSEIFDFAEEFSIPLHGSVNGTFSPFKPLLLSAWYRKSVIIGIKPFIAFSEPSFNPFKPFKRRCP
jgi:hypothetical protein